MTLAIGSSESIQEFTPSVETEIERLRALETSEVRRIDLQSKLCDASLNASYYHSEDATDPVPILLVPGLGAFKAAMESAAIETARLGRHAVTYDPATEQAWQDALHPINALNPARLQQRAVIKIMQAVRDNPEVTKFRGGEGNEADIYDTVGWSWGNRVAAGAASWLLRKPRGKDVTVRNVQSNAGAGNDDREGWEQLKNHAGSIGGLLVRDVWKGAPRMIRASQDPKEFKRNAIKHIVSGKGRIIGEAAYVAWRPRVHEFVQDIRNAGGLYGGNLYTDDSLFPPEDTIDMFDYYSIQPGEHSQLALEPREAALGVVAVSNMMASHYDMAMAAGITSAKVSK